LTNEVHDGDHWGNWDFNGTESSRLLQNSWGEEGAFDPHSVDSIAEVLDWVFQLRTRKASVMNDIMGDRLSTFQDIFRSQLIMLCGAGRQPSA